MVQLRNRGLNSISQNLWLMGALIYDKTTFAMMGYTLSVEVWVRHVIIRSTPVQVEPTTEPPETQSSATNNLQQIQRGLDGVKTMLIAMKEQMDKISDVTKKNRYRCSQTQDGHGSHKKIRNQDIQFHDREDEEGHQRS
nr:uncharacterized protein LOC117273458 isoform X1 [Nicotiana tomentosiformis]